MADNKKEEKTYSGSELQEAIAKVAQETAEKLLPVAMAAAVQSMSGMLPQGNRSGRPRNVGPKCEVCGLLVMACGGMGKIEGDRTEAKVQEARNKNHVKMCVYPERYPEFGGQFRGRAINGVWFLSNGPGHQIWVPKCSLGDIQSCIEIYEKNERETRLGRVKEHNSGDVSSPRRVSDLAAKEGYR